MTLPEAFCLIEFSSIARGTRAVDALIKKAPVKVEKFGTFQPGRLGVIFSGDVASVQESHGEVFRVAMHAVHDCVLLPHVHPDVYCAAMGKVGTFRGDTLGVVESATMAGAVHAADVAVKGAAVSVVKIHLGDELGGKGVAHLVGKQHDVEEAMTLLMTYASTVVRGLDTSITARADADLLELLANGTRFWGTAT